MSRPRKRSIKIIRRVSKLIEDDKDGGIPLEKRKRRSHFEIKQIKINENGERTIQRVTS